MDNLADLDSTDRAPYYEALDIGSPILWLHHLSLSQGDSVLYSGREGAGEYCDWDFIALEPQDVMLLEPHESQGREEEALARFDSFVNQPWRSDTGQVYSDTAWFSLGQTLQIIPPMIHCGLSYELGAQAKGIEPHDQHHNAPSLWAARYHSIYAYHRSSERGWLVACSLDKLGRLRDRLLTAHHKLNDDPLTCEDSGAEKVTWIREAFSPSLGYTEYLERFNRLQEAVLSGDVYQMNLTIPLKATLQREIPSTYLFQHLCSVNGGQFSALCIIDENRSILSLSPERLAKWSGRLGDLCHQKRIIETAPIKGTRPRRSDPCADESERQELISSEKDAAEHVMILDLERNDLGQICESGSVEVIVDREARRYATVHHLVSVIRGELSPHNGLLEILAAIFPGGSVTGAPKMRSMELIRHLESGARGIYCGALGYLDPCGGGDLNLPIRTLLRDRQDLIYHAGGGIVADSDPQEEWRELWVKTGGVESALRASPHPLP